MLNSMLLSVFIFVPVIGIFLASIFTMFVKNTKFLIIEQIGSIFVSLSNLALIFIMAFSFEKGMNLPSTLTGLFSINLFSLVILLLVQIVFLIVSLFSLKYISPAKQSQYFIFFFSLNLGINLILLSNNLFVLFICWELMVISGYILVSFNRTIESFEAGFKYLVISSIGSLFMLLGIGILVGLVPSLDYSVITSRNILSNTLGILSFTFILIGFITTGGAFLFNQWLPDAHPEAPAPVSALLSGIVVNMGIYGVYTICNIFTLTSYAYLSNYGEIILAIGLLTMFEGTLMVFVQFKKDFIDIKRILAYSTISHMGLLISITPINTNLGLIAIIYHIISHSLSKSLLFLMAGYLQITYHSRNLKELAGAGRKDKFAGVILIIGLLSLGAFPGTSGFVSELLVFMTIFSSIASLNLYVALGIILLVIFNSVLAFGGYLWLLKYLIFNEESETVKSVDSYLNNQTIIKYSVLELVVFILLLGLFPNVLISYITNLMPIGK